LGKTLTFDRLRDSRSPIPVSGPGCQRQIRDGCGRSAVRWLVDAKIDCGGSGQVDWFGSPKRVRAVWVDFPGGGGPSLARDRGAGQGVFIFPGWCWLIRGASRGLSESVKILGSGSRDIPPLLYKGGCPCPDDVVGQFEIVPLMSRLSRWGLVSRFPPRLSLELHGFEPVACAFSWSPLSLDALSRKCPVRCLQPALG